MDDLIRLAELLKQRNIIDGQISLLIGRPATTGHLGEFIASKVFVIRLMESASHKGVDGHFVEGLLAERSVNIKYSTRHDGLLDITPQALPDFFLVLAGPGTGAVSSRGQSHPHAVEKVFIFDARALLAELQRRKVKFGAATSVRKHLWEQAEIYPMQGSNLLMVTEKQRAMLKLFDSKGCD